MKYHPHRGWVHVVLGSDTVLYLPVASYRKVKAQQLVFTRLYTGYTVFLQLEYSSVP